VTGPVPIVRPPGEIIGRDAAGPVGARTGGPGRGIAGSDRRLACSDAGSTENEKRHRFCPLGLTTGPRNGLSCLRGYCVRPEA
jgi:hypothetical protein